MTTPTHDAALRSRRFPWKPLLRVALAVLLLGIVFFRIDLHKFAKVFAGLSPWHLLGAYVCYVASLIFKAFRWQRLGVPHRHVTALDCFSATALGFLFGLLVPGTFEFARAYVLKKRARVPFGSVVGIIVAERALDTVLLLVLIFLVLMLVPGARWLSTIAVAAAVLVIIGLGLLVLLVRTRDTSVPKLERALARFSPGVARRVAGFFGSFAEGLHRLGELKAKGVFTALGFSALLWVSRGFYILLVFRGLGISRGFGLALFLAAVEYLGVLIKITPAAIGQYQAIITGVLVAFGIEQHLAAGASIVLHGVRLIVILSLGLPFLYREHLGMAKLAREKAAATEAPPLPRSGDSPQVGPEPSRRKENFL